MVNQADKISHLLSSEEAIKQSFNELEKWSEQYPQVAIFKTLLAKSKQLNGHPGYQSALKSAALYAADRKKLYQFLVQPKIVSAIDALEAETNESENSIKSSNKEKTPSETQITQKSEQEESQHKTPQENEVRELKPEDEQARRILEQEILQHAVSSSIILDADSTTNIEESQEENESRIENLPPEPVEKTESKAIENRVENFEHLSVLDWLKLDSNAVEESPPKKPAENTSDLIDQFIKKDPQRIGEEEKAPTKISIQKPKTEFFSPENMAKMSLMEDENLVTETLAKIYAQQGNISKAKKTYEKLSLKFPEKRDYFARLIQELGNKQ